MWFGLEVLNIDDLEKYGFKDPRSPISHSIGWPLNWINKWSLHSWTEISIARRLLNILLVKILMPWYTTIDRKKKINSNYWNKRVFSVKSNKSFMGDSNMGPGFLSFPEIGTCLPFLSNCCLDPQLPQLVSRLYLVRACRRFKSPNIIGVEISF